MPSPRPHLGIARFWRRRGARGLLLGVILPLALMACPGISPSSCAPAASGTSSFSSPESRLAARPPSLGGVRDAAGWWIETYGLAPPSTPGFARAQAVFDRVSAAADKSSHRLPRMVIVDAADGPFAASIRDGSVILTRGALELCYAPGLPAQRGDERLALVLGHELAHLSSERFWHVSAFDDARVGTGGVPRDAADRSSEGSRSLLRGVLRQATADPAGEELEADEKGLLYLTFAGYDPRPLLSDDRSFFEEWVGEATRAAAFDLAAGERSHPAPADRAESLRRHLTEVADQAPLFHLGTRLLGLGRTEEAILLLARFAERFPSREVLSNLGLAHLQLALRQLGTCDGALLTRYRVPSRIDEHTLARRITRRGGSASVCLEAEAFRAAAREASALLQAATERDPSYLPARLNLIALFLLSDQPARALSAAEDARAVPAREIGGQVADPALRHDLRTAAALALHAYGTSSGLDLTDRVLAELESVLTVDPRHRAALFNRAVVLSQARRTAAARSAWQRFLEAEPEGPYADVARAWLGQEPTRRSLVAERPAADPGGPWSLGPLSPATVLRLAETRRSAFAIGDFVGATYDSGPWMALEVDGRLELVIRRVGSDGDPADQSGRIAAGPEFGITGAGAPAAAAAL